jgi:hypothetical protein
MNCNGFSIISLSRPTSRYCFARANLLLAKQTLAYTYEIQHFHIQIKIYLAIEF